MLIRKNTDMDAGNFGGNAGEKENNENMGIPKREREKPDENLEATQQSLPSDGPVSQSEGTDAPDLDSNLEHGDPADSNL